MCLVLAVIKLLVFAFNFAFVVVGVALITVGILYKVDFNDIHDAMPDSYSSIEVAPTLTIVIGCIILVIAFFGCCGVLRMSVCLLNTYAIILLTIFVLQVALSVYVFLQVKDDTDLQKEVKKHLTEIFDKYKPNQLKSIDTNEVVDFVQKELECCGIDGPSYWAKSIPKSCYEDEDTKKKPYDEGCVDAMFDFIHDAAHVIGIVVLCLAATLIGGAILALCLSNSVRNEGRRTAY